MAETHAQCSTCGQDRPFRHMHDEAHGIAGTHMAGSERFECTVCGEALYATDGHPTLKFVLDGTESHG